MANKVQLKRSAVPGKVPATTDLDLGEIAINTYDGKAYIKKNVSGTESIVPLGGAGSGDVTGPNSSTDNAIARFDGASGKIIQNSTATIDDSGNLTAASNNASGTGSDTMPVGTTAQRPTGATGKHRMNSTLGTPEWFDPATSTWVPFADPTPASYFAEVLVIGGGGAGGATNGGGGGAGAVIVAECVQIMKGKSYTVTIGAGGAGSTSGASNGTPSYFGQVMALGGGAGSGVLSGQSKTGGSGGGGKGESGDAGGFPMDGRGFRGGDGVVSPRVSAGGGGAAGRGQNGGEGGVGGAAIELWGYAQICSAGVGQKFAGGGGGGTESVSRTADGGGGGAGASPNGGVGGDAVANTGSGGGGGSRGGGSSGEYRGGNGGSGIVIIRYFGAQAGSGGTVYTTNSGGMTFHKFTSSSTFTG